MSSKPTSIWDSEKIDKLMEEYKSMFTVEKDKSVTPQKVTFVLKKGYAQRKADFIYTQIYKAHDKLFDATMGHIRATTPTQASTMKCDILSCMYEAMMLYWTPGSGSSMSYFINIIRTRIPWYFNGKLASSPTTGSPSKLKDPIHSIPIGNRTKEEAREELITWAKERYYNTEDYEIQSQGANTLTLYRIYYSEEEILPDSYDIQETQELDHIWEDICPDLLAEYVPDVVTAPKYNHLAIIMCSLVKGLVTWNKGNLNDKGQSKAWGTVDGIQHRLPKKHEGPMIWLLHALQKHSDIKLTMSDVKLCLYTVRSALKLYLEDYPVDKPYVYGSNGILFDAGQEY